MQLILKQLQQSPTENFQRIFIESDLQDFLTKW